MRVSKWVNKLVCPYVYYTVQFKKESQAKRFLFTITHHPELCQYIVKFEVPEITDPLKLGFLQEREIWVHSFDKKSPNFRTIAKITRILLEASVHQDENKKPSFRPPITSRLQSVTINAFYLSSFQCHYRDLGLVTAQKLVLPPIVAITSLDFRCFTNGPPAWDYTRIKRLRFTSSMVSIEEFLPELLSLPELTHLAFELSVDVVENTNWILACPRIQRVVIFTHFGPTSTTVPRRIAGVSQTITSTESFGTVALWEGIDALEAIMDDRLILSDLNELERTYKMSNEEFWDAVDQL